MGPYCRENPNCLPTARTNHLSKYVFEYLAGFCRPEFFVYINFKKNTKPVTKKKLIIQYFTGNLNKNVSWRGFDRKFGCDMGLTKCAYSL